MALTKCTRFTKAWDAFYQATKSWAYWQDELPTTHPIETPVPDTDTTHTNFDGITYGKGASLLKQIAYALGDEPFRKGVAHYLKKFSWKNAQRKDFMKSLEQASGQSLGKWTKLWLQSSGTNSITPVLKHDGKKVTQFALEQGKGNGDGLLRPHALEVGMFQRKRNGGLKEIARSSVRAEKAKTKVPEFVGKPKPDFVFANLDDQGFAKFGLDPDSLEFALQHLEELPTVMLRGAVWKSIWGMIRDGSAPAVSLPELFVSKAKLETNDHIVSTAFANAKTVVDRYLPENQRDEWILKLQELAWNVVRKAKQGSDLQKVWFQALLATAEDEEALARLRRMLKGQEFVPGVELDQDKRWAMARKLAAKDHPETKLVLAEETQNDRSEKGQGMALAAEFARPDAGAKAAAWERFVEDEDSPLDLLRMAMDGFWVPHQADLLKPYAKRFFQALPKIEKGRSTYFTDAFVAKLYPLLVVDPAVLKLGETTVAKGKKMPVGIKRSLIEQNFELQIALRARG